VSALAAPAAPVLASSPSPPPAQSDAVLDPNFRAAVATAGTEPTTTTTAVGAQPTAAAVDAAVVPGQNADAAVVTKDEPIKMDTDASMAPSAAPASAPTVAGVKSEGDAAPAAVAVAVPGGVIAVDP